MIKYLCKKCNIITAKSECDICGSRTAMTSKLYWCKHCNVPIYNEVYPICSNNGIYFATDARPVFPEERLLIESVLGEPMKFHNSSVWNSNGIYYVDGKKIKFSIENLASKEPKIIRKMIAEHEAENSYDYFDSASE